MLIPVWPGLNFWYILGIISSPSWFFSLLAMDFFKKTSGFVFTFLILTLLLLWSAGNFVLSMLYFSLRRNPNTDRLFLGYQRAGKTFGYALLFFGNVGLYYLSEKSVASILTFLFLAFSCICTLFCIQPYTDFGTIEFLLSASLNQTLSLFGLRSSYSWLVIIACILIAGIRYHLEPVHPPGLEATSDEGQLDSGKLLPITSALPPPPRIVLLPDGPDSPRFASFGSEDFFTTVPETVTETLREWMEFKKGPGIRDFQIIGEAKPGYRLLGCGFPVRGTSLCMFQWVRHLQDGTRQYIEGATAPEYVVTADDVDKLIAVECIPMDDQGRQGELVWVFANGQNKITCDPDMQLEIDSYIYKGGATFSILLLLDASEIWEPTTLILKRSGFLIKDNRSQETLIAEKFSKDLSNA
ncbi:uncharacterized protein LOC131333538 isoform X2 [Rhododendron vialii]|uniref:uncharacterized protein LOC131333538 isoform X2 n=1 Tax=Rhododendron vialii TaxID=182163 RepID=UPI00265EE603|nr:uncharacterized protein LOC131333538 isoform X2 [Rhododendron vialii]